jgi:carbon monoxide dehydrogenase subunit G
MKVEKKFTVRAPIQKVWDTFNQPQLIAQCIDGCESVEEFEPKKYKANVKVEVGPVKASFKLDINELERDELNYLVYDTSGDEGARSSSLKAKSKVTVKALGDNETEVLVTSDFNVIGRLGTFGSGMMNKIIDSISAETINAICAYIERGELPSAKKGPGKLTIIYWVVVALIAAGVASFFI